MKRQQTETYWPTERADTAPPQCVVAGCQAPAIAELFDANYSDGLRVFRGIDRKVLRARRLGDERIFTCQRHFDTDPRMKSLIWQTLMFPEGETQPERTNL